MDSSPNERCDLLMMPSRRRGRPRAVEPKSAVMTWVPTTYHDRIAQLARQQGVSVSSVVCEAIEQHLKTRR